MSRDIYEFANGVRVYRRRLLDMQVARYAEPGNPNLHEPVEEEWIARAIKQAGEGRFVFVDIGAAIGYYSVLVKKHRSDARIIAAEALPVHVAAFQETVALNGLRSDEFEIVEKAIWKEAGVVVMADKDFSTHVFDPDHPGRPADTFEAPAVAIGDFIASIGEPVSLAKMDVQGAEAEIIPAYMASSSKRLVGRWIIGTHGPTIHNALLEALEVEYEIVHADPAPDFQPDGLIVAALR